MELNLFNFNIKETKTFKALKWSPFFEIFKFLKKVFLTLFFIALLFFIFRFLDFGFALLFFTLFLVSLYFEKFFDSKIKKPSIIEKKWLTLENVISQPENYNLADFFSFQAIRAIWQAIDFSKKRKLSEINSSAILYYCLKENGDLDILFKRALLDLNEIKEELKNYLKSLKGEGFKEIFSETSKRVILESLKITQKKEKIIVDTWDILAAEAKFDPVLKKFLIDANLKPEDIENLVYWQESFKKRIEKRKKFWEWENLIRAGSIGKDWAAGYTITLDKFSIDWTEVIKRRGFEEIIGHKSALEQLERVLANPEIHNALLVGEPGSGRKSIIHALAQRVLVGQSLPEINYKRIVELDIISVLASSQSGEEVASILETIFNEAATAGNVSHR